MLLGERFERDIVTPEPSATIDEGARTYLGDGGGFGCPSRQIAVPVVEFSGRMYGSSGMTIHAMR